MIPATIYHEVTKITKCFVLKKLVFVVFVSL